MQVLGGRNPSMPCSCKMPPKSSFRKSLVPVSWAKSSFTRNVLNAFKGAESAGLIRPYRRAKVAGLKGTDKRENTLVKKI